MNEVGIGLLLSFRDYHASRNLRKPSKYDNRLIKTAITSVVSYLLDFRISYPEIENYEPSSFAICKYTLTSEPWTRMKYAAILKYKN